MSQIVTILCGGFEDEVAAVGGPLGRSLRPGRRDFEEASELTAHDVESSLSGRTAPVKPEAVLWEPMPDPRVALSPRNRVSGR